MRTITDQALPHPVFVGFFPKATMAAPPEFVSFGVEEIAAVSECMSSAPEGWVDQWKHNTHGFYDSEELAISIIPSDKVSSYDLYAYEMLPLEYAEEIEPLDVPPAPGRVPDDYEFLGYDIVSRSMAILVECSLLSCNLGAKEFPVNTYCLITSLPDAFAAFKAIGDRDEGYEPGPYHLFAVHRKRR